MIDFEYRAVSRDEYKSGRIQANSAAEAQTILTEQGLTVISLRTRSPLEIGILSNLMARLDTFLHERMSTSEKILFTGQLSSMVTAGLPLTDALSSFIDQQSSAGSARVLNRAVAQIQAGVKFSDALSPFPKIFPPTYLAVIRAGENSETLAESLGYLADQMRRENDLATKVKSALIYPSVVVTAMVTVMIFVSISVVPKILLFAQSTGQRLPDYTLALVRGVTTLTNYWYLFLVLGAVLIAAILAFIRSPFGSRWIGVISLKLPYLGTLVARYNQTRFCRILGGFYKYGVSVISSFDILAESLGNPLFKEACLRINEKLTRGSSLADAMASERKLFPSVMVRLIKGAEKTGNLGDTLDKLARFYEEELEVALRNMLALIEPALVFILGFGVLVLALIVVVPIYRITSSIR